MIREFLLIAIIILNFNLFPASAGASAGAGDGASAGDGEPVEIHDVLPIRLSPSERAKTGELIMQFKQRNIRGYRALMLATSDKPLPGRQINMMNRGTASQSTTYDAPGRTQELGAPPTHTREYFITPFFLRRQGGYSTARYKDYSGLPGPKK